MAKRIILFDQLEGKGVPLGKTQIWRLENAGKFPKRIFVSPGRYGWVEDEVDAYIDQKIAERDEKVATKAARTNAASARRSCDA